MWMNLVTLNVKTFAKKRDAKVKQQTEVVFTAHITNKTLVSRIFRL